MVIQLQYKLNIIGVLILQIIFEPLHTRIFMQSFNIFLIILPFFHLLISSQLTKSTYASSGVFLVYQNAITSMPQSVNNSYTKTFDSNFSNVPIVVAGINDYKMFDFFRYQNFQFHIHLITIADFQIFTMAISSTNIRKFSISYLAMQNRYSNMFYFQKIYDNQGNIYLGSGNRFAVIVQNFTLDSGGEYLNSNSTQSLIISITIGYFIQSNTVYNVQINGLILNTEQYQINLIAYGDCLLESVRVGILLINNLTHFSDNDVYFDFGYKSITQNDTVWDYVQLPNVDFMLGILDFYSPDVSISRNTFGWTYVTNSTTEIQIAITNLQTATYLYIVYASGHLTPTPPTPAPTKVSETTAFPVGAVIVPIVLVIIIGVGVFIYKKYFVINTSSRQLKVNQQDQFLPQFF